MKLSFHLTLLCTALFFHSSCKKEEPVPATPPVTSSKVTKKAGPLSSQAPVAMAKNSYIEKKWQLGEPETDAEKAWEEAVTVDEKLTVIGIEESTGPEGLAPVVRRALRHSNEKVRIHAIQTASGFQSVPKDAVDIITAGTFDESSEVRAYSMEMALEQPLETKMMIFDNTINSPQKDVRETAAVELGRHPSKESFEILMKGLTNEDPEFISKVNEEIKLLVNKEFPTWREASAWWQTNSEKFDERMIQMVD
jgi:hypothetical protein